MKPNLDDLDPLMRDDIKTFLAQLNETTYRFKAICVLRSAKEQDALYAQGRSLLDMVNSKRRLVGWNDISMKENTKIVTRTKTSNHMANKDGFSEAVDIVAMDRFSGNIIWDDTKSEQPYKLAYTISKAFPILQAGYEWGWDKGHYELRRPK